MTALSDIAVAILAAGRSERYSADKLMVPLGGIPLGLHIGNTLSTLDFGWRFVICGKESPLRRSYSDLGFTVIENAVPENGQWQGHCLSSSRICRLSRRSISKT